MESALGMTSTGYEHVKALLGAERCVVLDGAVGTELPNQHGVDRTVDERLWGLQHLS